MAIKLRMNILTRCLIVRYYGVYHFRELLHFFLVRNK